MTKHISRLKIKCVSNVEKRDIKGKKRKEKKSHYAKKKKKKKVITQKKKRKKNTTRTVHKDLNIPKGFLEGQTIQ
jgi:hypothetical protein